MASVFEQRATQLSAARNLLHDDNEDSYTAALALLAVHAAISWNDAVLYKLTGKILKNKDHRAAVLKTKLECASLKLNNAGIKHLEKLVGAKTDVAYGDRQTTPAIAERLSLTSQSFEAWAHKILEGEL